MKTYKNTIDLSLIKPQLYVIDMINGFCKEGALSDPKIMKIADPILELIKNIDPQRITFIADTHKADDLEFKAFPPHCIKGTIEAEIIDELKPYVKMPILEKNTTNAFHELIKSKNRHLLEITDTDSYILVGCCTDICVLQFALSLRTWLNAAGQDKRVLIPRNCVETFDSPNHDSIQKNKEACALMQEAGIEIIEQFDIRRN